MNFSRPLVVAIALLAAGCGTLNTYNPPEGDSGKLATVRGHSTRDGLFEWVFHRVDTVDNRSVSYIFLDPDYYDLPVTPEKHRFLVYTEFNRSLFDACPCQAFTYIQADLKAGAAYKLNGKVDGPSVTTWIEDSKTGARVSEVASANFRVAPRETYIPIIIAK